MKASLIRCVLIEDEVLAAGRLHRMLLQADAHVEVVAELGSVAQARRWFANALPVDLIFADVQLADGLCFDIFESHPSPTPIVLTTSYDEYALQAFKYERLGYLLKPIKRSELQAIMHDFRASRLAGSTHSYGQRIRAFLARLFQFGKNQNG